MKGALPVRVLCDLLEVSPSGYYRWLEAKPTARQQRDAELLPKVVHAHRVVGRRSYGAPRVCRELRAAGERVSTRRCARLMKLQGLQGKKRHRRRPKTTNSNHPHPVAANVLPLVEVIRPNQAWVCDITYIRTGEGWLYLAAILDVHSRAIVGWACAPTMHTELVLSALERALRRRGTPQGLIHHSDRGSQYADRGYRARLDAAGITPSMSRAGNCYDNSMIESFWSTLKTESDLETAIPATRAQAELDIFDYIETFYNPTRRHSSLGYLSPVAFEKLKINNHRAA